MKYYSDVTKEMYNSIDDLNAAEKKAADVEKHKEELKKQREARAKEVENAYKDAREAQKKANSLLSKFCQDYGSFHTTLHEDDYIDDPFLRLFLKW